MVGKIDTPVCPRLRLQMSMGDCQAGHWLKPGGWRGNTRQRRKLQWEAYNGGRNRACQRMRDQSKPGGRQLLCSRLSAKLHRSSTAWRPLTPPWHSSGPLHSSTHLALLGLLLVLGLFVFRHQRSCKPACLLQQGAVTVLGLLTSICAWTSAKSIYIS